MMGRGMAKKFRGHVHDVFASLPQRGYIDMHHAKPMIQILSKCALLNGFLKIHIGGGNDADIRFIALMAADSLKRAVLQQPQQFALQQ